MWIVFYGCWISFIGQDYASGIMDVVSFVHTADIVDENHQQFRFWASSKFCWDTGLQVNTIQETRGHIFELLSIACHSILFMMLLCFSSYIHLVAGSWHFSHNQWTYCNVSSPAIKLTCCKISYPCVSMVKTLNKYGSNVFATLTRLSTVTR